MEQHYIGAMFCSLVYEAAAPIPSHEDIRMYLLAAARAP